MKFLFDRYRATGTRFVWEVGKSSEMPEAIESATETNESFEDQEALRQIVKSTDITYTAAESVFSNEDLPNKEYYVLITLESASDFLKEIRATSEISPEGRDQIRSLMREYHQMCASFGVSYEVQKEFGKRAQEIVNEIQSILPDGFVAKNNRTLTPDNQSGGGQENVAAEWYERSEIRITKIRPIHTRNVTEKDNTGLDVEDAAAVIPPEDIKEDFDALSDDPKDYVRTPEQQTRIISSAFKDVREAFAGDKKSFVKAVNAYVQSHPESEILSSEEIDSLFAAVTGAHDGEEPFESLQLVMSKLDVRLLGTMEENGGVDNKLGYASLTAILQVSSELIQMKQTVKEIDYWKGMEVLSYKDDLNEAGEAFYLGDTAPLARGLGGVVEKKLAEGFVKLRKKSVGGMIENFDFMEDLGDTIDDRIKEIYDKPLVKLNDGTQLSLRQVMQKSPRALNQALQKKTTNGGGNPLEEVVSAAINAVTKLEASRAKWKNIWHEGGAVRAVEKLTVENHQQSVEYEKQQDDEFSKILANLPGQGGIGMLDFAMNQELGAFDNYDKTPAELSAGLARIDKIFKRFDESKNSSDNYDLYAETAMNALEAAMGRSWSKVEQKDEVIIKLQNKIPTLKGDDKESKERSLAHQQKMKETLTGEFAQLVKGGRYLCKIVSKSGSPLLAEFTQKINNRLNAINEAELLALEVEETTTEN